MSEVVNDEGVRLSWRAAILPQGGASTIYGRLCRLSKNKAVVRMDHNLRPGCHCKLVLLVPKSHPGETTQFIEGRSVVSTSVLSSTQFHITFDWLEMNGNGENLLNEQMNRIGKCGNGFVDSAKR